MGWSIKHEVLPEIGNPQILSHDQQVIRESSQTAAKSKWASFSLKQSSSQSNPALVPLTRQEGSCDGHSQKRPLEPADPTRVQLDEQIHAVSLVRVTESLPADDDWRKQTRLSHVLSLLPSDKTIEQAQNQREANEKIEQLAQSGQHEESQ